MPIIAMCSVIFPHMLRAIYPVLSVVVEVTAITLSYDTQTDQSVSVHAKQPLGGDPTQVQLLFCWTITWNQQQIALARPVACSKQRPLESSLPYSCMDSIYSISAHILHSYISSGDL